MLRFRQSTRSVLEFGGDVEWLEGRNRVTRELSPVSGLITLNDYDERTSAASAYGQIRTRLGSRLTVTPGARVDHWTLTSSTTASPWINAELRLGERTRVRGGSGVYRQFPGLEEVYGRSGRGRGLRPERALHVDAGVERTLPRQTRLLVNVYARRERDVLWRPGSEPRLAPNGTIQRATFDAPLVNALEGEARGLEVTVRRDTTDGFSGWAGYAYSRLRYTETATGEQFWADADQRHTLSMYGNYRLSDRTSMSARYRYGSNYPWSATLGNRRQPRRVPVPVVDGDRCSMGSPTSATCCACRRTHAWTCAPIERSTGRAADWCCSSMSRTFQPGRIFATHPPSWIGAGRVFDTTESLMPIVPSGGFVIEF